MFFSQVEDKLVKRKYTSPEQFNADMRLAFDNCQLYNPPDDPFRKLGQKVEAEYDQLWVASGLADSETMEARGKRATAGVARPKYEPVAPSKPKDSQGGKRAKVGGAPCGSSWGLTTAVWGLCSAGRNCRYRVQRQSGRGLATWLLPQATGAG